MKLKISKEETRLKEQNKKEILADKISDIDILMIMGAKIKQTISKIPKITLSKGL